MTETLALNLARSPQRKKRWIAKINWIGIGTLVLLLVLWELSHRLGAIKFDFIPAPSGIVTSAGELFEEGAIQAAIVHTAGVALVGWLMACIIGITVGTTLGISRTLWRWTAASIEVLRSFPSITFVPLAVLLFGFSSAMELVVVVYAASWQVLVNTLDGVHTVSPGLRDVARTFRLGRVRNITAIVLPAAASKIIVGLRLGLNLALILAVAAEVVGNPAGLGYGLTVEQQALQPARMFVYFISVGLLGIVLNAILQLVISVTLPGITAVAEKGRRS
ncbi:ABC transporter permease [Paramicrobacterium chengjingii]|uniref:ABC transporter permease n=1 Tax=Paramicrobacterium chengjingii TaxID=2769067 RepID=UPI00141DC476|nr:ABC transporter permease [Microbacterium chengjingii]